MFERENLDFLSISTWEGIRARIAEQRISMLILHGIESQIRIGRANVITKGNLVLKDFKNGQ